MSVWFNPQDHYFRQAKKDGYVARSAYKLEEIDQKFGIFWPKTRTVVDIGCAPGSRLQYVSSKITKFSQESSSFPLVIGFDLKQVQHKYPGVSTFVQDITDQEAVKRILAEKLWTSVDTSSYLIDVIISDMAPDTLGDTSTDAMRSIGLIYDTMWMYHDLLKLEGKFVIKVFMGPWFDDLVQYCRDNRWSRSIKIFKPKACRSTSKETYIVKV